MECGAAPLSVRPKRPLGAVMKLSKPMLKAWQEQRKAEQEKKEKKEATSV
jgi:hypothetical protein